MLSDDPAIRAVLLEPGVLGVARKGLVHVVTSTISVAFATELATTMWWRVWDTCLPPCSPARTWLPEAS